MKSYGRDFLHWQHGQAKPGEAIFHEFPRASFDGVDDSSGGYKRMGTLISFLLEVHHV